MPHHAVVGGESLKPASVAVGILLIGVFVVPLAAMLPQPAAATTITLSNLPPRVVSSIQILQIKNESLVYANFNEELANARKPTNVSIVNTLISPDSDPSVGITYNFSVSLAVTIANPIVFGSWENESGVLTSGGNELLDIQNVTRSYPDYTVPLRLFMGSNYSIDPPVVSTSIPTYTVDEHYTDYTNKSVPAAYGGISYVKELFDHSKYVAAVDIYLGHSDGFRTFAHVAQYTPALIIVIAFLLAVFAIARPAGSKTTDYVQALLTLLLFVPLFAFGLGQLVPQGNSVYLQSWLSLVGFWTGVSLPVVTASTIAVILRQAIGRVGPPSSFGATGAWLISSFSARVKQYSILLLAGFVLFVPSIFFPPVNPPTPILSACNYTEFCSNIATPWGALTSVFMFDGWNNASFFVELGVMFLATNFVYSEHETRGRCKYAFLSMFVCGILPNVILLAIRPNWTIYGSSGVIYSFLGIVMGLSFFNMLPPTFKGLTVGRLKAYYSSSRSLALLSLNAIVFVSLFFFLFTNADLFFSSGPNVNVFAHALGFGFGFFSTYAYRYYTRHSRESGARLLAGHGQTEGDSS